MAKNTAKFLVNWPKTFFICFFIVLITLLWSRYVSTSGFIVKEYNVKNKKLPPSFHGLKVVHLSDIHYGRIIKEPTLKAIRKRVNLINPDIIVFTGDLIDKSTPLTKDIKNIIIKELSKMNAKYA